MAAPTLKDPLAGAPPSLRPGGEASVDAGLTPVGGVAAPIFSAADVQELAYRRFNPFAYLTPERLAQALDAFEAGDPRLAAILWRAVIRRDPTIATIHAKRAEAVALRDWTVVPVDNSPAAQDQAAALTNFYKNIVAADALNIHATGAFPLLATQMMDALPFGFAVHHIIWQPNAARTIKLPSGAVLPGLTARLEQVPLEFFEFRTGALRFLGLNQAYTGAPLVPGAWLITTGPCLMMAASFKHYAKRLAEQDLINFSEKFGTPGLMLHTTAQRGTPEGDNAEHAARSIGATYRGVAFGATENKTEFIWPSGGTGSGNLPMTSIIEEIKRELTSLWLGADLSTMSRGGSAKGVGASLQADEQEKRERADCARITETLNGQVDPTVIRWYFGDGAPILARVVLESPINEDRALLISLVSDMVGMGAQVPVAEIARRLQVPLANKGDDVLTKPAGIVTATPDTYIAANVDTRPPAGTERASEQVQRTAAALYAAAKGKDLKPVLDRLDEIKAIENPVIRRAALVKYVSDLPTLLARINREPAAAGVEADAMSANLFNGLIEAAAATHGATATNANDQHEPAGTSQGGEFAPKVGSIDAVLDHARTDKNRDAFHDYQEISDYEAAAIHERSGMDVRGYKRVLSSSAVTHILTRHGSDPRPITEDDFRQLASHLAQPASQQLSRVTGKPDRLVSEVRDASGHLTIVEEQRTGRGKLALVSMYHP